MALTGSQSMLLDAVGGRALALERRFHGVLQRRFERRLGIETTQLVDLGEVGIAHKERVFYVAVPPIALRSALSRLRPGRADVFVDLGAGKGQAVIVAGLLPLGRVIGVELAGELTTIARRNVAAVSGRLRCGEIELVDADALDWEVPDDLSIVHMYCPFIGEVFRAVVRRLLDSLDARPRPLFLIYGYPWEHNWLIRTGRVKTVDVNFARSPPRPGWWDSDHVLVTYQLTCRDGSAPSRPVAAGGYGWRKAMGYWGSENETQFVLHPPGGGDAVHSERPRS